MKKIFLISMALILCLSTILFSFVKEEHYKQADTFILTGMIDEKYPITMYLTIDKDNNVKGKYYYDKVKKYIQVNGKANRSGIILEEKVDNELTGEFVGFFDKDNITYNGNWINAKTKKQMPFSLSKNEIYTINHMQVLKYEYKYEYSDDINLEYEDIYFKLINDKNLRGINIINNIFSSDILENMNYVSKWQKDWLYYVDEVKREYDYDPFGYIFNFSVSFLYTDKNIISIADSYWEFTGGAHGYGASAYKIYNVNTGKLLNDSINDLIKDVNNPKLISIMRQKLKENYSEEYFFNFDEIRLNDNYYIDIEGIHFIYNQYEIAPYSSGQLYLSFSFDELKPFVKKSSPFLYLLE